MDVTDIRYDDNYFDVIIDKGTMDALLCGNKSFLSVAIMLKEVQRLIKTDGVFISISAGKPDNRIFHIERDFLSFEINIYTIKKEYYLSGGVGKHEKVC